VQANIRPPFDDFIDVKCRHFPTTCRFTCILFNGAVPLEFRCFPFLPELRLLLSYTLWRSSDISPVICEKIFTVSEMLLWLPGIVFVFIPEPLNQKFLSDLFTTFDVTVGRVSTARLLGMCGNHG
jgi:hypothetical protein